MMRRLFLVAGILFAFSLHAATPGGTAGAYNVVTDTLDAGGLPLTSAMYSHIGSVGGIEGVSGSATYTAKHGYIAQLFGSFITSSLSTTGLVGQSFSYQIAANLPATAYAANGALPAGLTLNGTTGVISGIPTAAGTSSVTITATTSDGDANAVLTIVITSTAPAITSLLTASAVVGQPFSYTITASGATPIIFTASPLPVWMTQSGPTLSGTPDATGTLNITLSASNGSGMDSKTLVLTVNPAGAPAITSALTATAVVGAPFTYTTTASGNAPITFTASPLPSGLSVSNGVITGMPSTVGVTNVKLTAMNALGSDTKILVLTIAAAGAPVITSALNMSGRVAVPFSYPITVNSGATTPITYDAKPLPAGLSLVGNVITGTPSVSGNFSVTLSATNAAGSDTKVLALAIRSPSALSPQVLEIDISRNPARTNTDVSFTVTAVSTPTAGLNFYWYFFDAAGVQDGPSLTGATVTRQFATEGSFFAVVRVFDGLDYGQDSQKFGVSQLAPNLDGIGANIADSTDDPTGLSAASIHIGETVAGVLNFDIAGKAKSGKNFFSVILGRTDPSFNDNTAFKFTQSEIVLLQAMDVIPPSTPGNVVAARMVAISQREVSPDATVLPPAKGTGLAIKKFSTQFNFGAKTGKRTDTLGMSFDVNLPGGLNFSAGETIYFGIGGVIVKLVSHGKGKPVVLVPESAPVALTVKAFTIATKGKTGTSTAKDAPATVTLAITSKDLVNNAFQFSGIDTTPTTGRTIALEALLLIDGVSYRQVFNGKYVFAKGKGTLGLPK